MSEKVPAEVQGVTASDVQELCGDILDWKTDAILALHPAVGDVVAAVAWASGQDELGQEGRPLEGLTAQIYDLLTADEVYGEER